MGSLYQKAPRSTAIERRSAGLLICKCFYIEADKMKSVIEKTERRDAPQNRDLA